MELLQTYNVFTIFAVLESQTASYQVLLASCGVLRAAMIQLFSCIIMASRLVLHMPPSCGASCMAICEWLVVQPWSCQVMVQPGFGHCKASSCLFRYPPPPYSHQKSARWLPVTGCHRPIVPVINHLMPWECLQLDSKCGPVQAIV